MSLMAKKQAAETKKRVNFMLDPGTLERIDALAAKYRFLNRTDVLRAIIEEGLPAVEEDENLLLKPSRD